MLLRCLGEKRVRMGLMLNTRERAQLAEAASKQKRVRNWRRMRAIELLAEGRSPEAVAAALGCARSSVCMRGPRRGERWGFRGFKKGYALAGSVRFRGKLSCFWEGS
jgi:Homeodomain-like domain